MALQRQVMRDGACEHDAVDASRRCAGNRVDDDPDIGGAGQEVKEVLVGMLDRLQFAGVNRWCSSAVAVKPEARSAHQVQDLTAHTVHVNGQRNAAIEHERKSEFDFLHAATMREITPGLGRFRVPVDCESGPSVV